MPRIHVLDNCAIYVYADDHAPPHFHVRGPDSDALIDIESLVVSRGVITRSDYAAAVEWARANRDVLLAKWSKLNERD